MANFKYLETTTPSKKILNVIKTELTNFTQYPFDSVKETAVANAWAIHSEVVDTATGNIKELIIKGVMKIGTLTKTFYVKLINRALVPNTSVLYVEHSTIDAYLLENFDSVAGTFGLVGHPVKFQWADEKYTPTDRNADKPVYLYLNIMNNRLSMVAVGDPAVNFNDYRKSFMYVGALEPFKYNMDDVAGNVMITAGSVVAEPTSAQMATAGTHYFGEYTSAGNNTFQMLKTHSGIEFQKHYPSFITQAPPKGSAYIDAGLGDVGLELEKQGFQASKWTSKYHLSPVYIIHPYEGYRGKLDKVIALTKHNILHLDELIIDVEGQAYTKEVYRYFDINTEQNFMNYSANQKMGVAILKEVRY